MGSRLDKMMLGLFVLGACVLSLVYGYVSFAYEIFPYQLFRQAMFAYRELVKADDAAFYRARLQPGDFTPPGPSAVPGLTLMTMVNQDDAITIKVVDRAGATIYERAVDWFQTWPEPEHLRREDPLITDPNVTAFGALPKARPGTHIHGIALMDNGDFVFNFEHLGMVRIDGCGRTVWRLPYRTHHSIEVDSDGTIWASGQINHYQPSPDFPNHVPPFIEYTAVQVSPDGKILREISIPEILRKNDLAGLLYMANTANRRTDVTGDTLHLNDVEPFPTSLREGYFRRGDIMVSLRNINAVFVFEAATGKVKYLNVGRFVRQHDPDFVDGDTISVFDNNNLAPGGRNLKSRIVIERPALSTHEVYYDGDARRSFYTSILGKHQWLPGGNLLVTESQGGRVFELDRDRRIVWEYVNFVGGDMVGLVQEATRLAPKFDPAFFAGQALGC